MSLKRRFSFKLATNLVGFFIGIVTQSIVPRALGPAAYGNYSFLTNYFLQIVGFLNLNSSSALYTKLSQRQKDSGLLTFYLYFSLLLITVLALFLITSFSAKLQEAFWPGQSVAIIIMAAVWAYLRFCGDTLILISDALGLTVKSEMVNMLQKMLGLFAILLLFWRHQLILVNFFMVQLFLAILIVVLLVLVIKKSECLLTIRWRLTGSQFNQYLKEFMRFCLPLVWFAGFAVSASILERWLIQKYSGSEQQGFFGLAYQVGAICFLFIAAIIPLISRELAISFDKKDIAEMGRLFSRFVPMLFAIAAYFSCFLAVQAKNVILIFGGKAYSAAVMAIMIMCLYPMHQVYGQMNAAVYFATDRTTTYRNIGMIFIAIELIASLFVLGPKEYGALNLGATGLAIQMVCIQFISVNINLWFNTRLMKVSFKKFIGHQASVMLVFLSVAVLCSYAVQSFLLESNFLLSFIISGILYTLFILFLAITFPKIFASKRQELINILLFRKLKTI